MFDDQSRITEWLNDVALHLSSVADQYQQGLPNVAMAVQRFVDRELPCAKRPFFVVVLPKEHEHVDGSREDLDLLEGILFNGLKCEQGEFVVTTPDGYHTTVDEMSAKEPRPIVSLVFGCTVTNELSIPCLIGSSLQSLRTDLALKKQYWGLLKDFISSLVTVQVK